MAMTRPAQGWVLFTLLAGSALALSGCSETSYQRVASMPSSQAASEAARAPTAAGAAPSMPAAKAAPDPGATYNPNMYVSSTYMGGSGERDRLEKLVNEGVLVDGKTVKLESFSHTYAQSFPIPTQTSLAVVADPERTRILEQGGRTFLQVGLQASKGEAARRPALNVALVIDVSGSMNEEGKMEAAKAAALRLIEGLAPADILSVVAFDGQAHVVFPAQPVGKAFEARRIIAALSPGSNTNIYDGLRLGYQEARKYSQRDGVNLAILLSDGEVTAGVTDEAMFKQLASETAEADIQTTSVGLGVSFNEDLMLSIAREGKGNYHFIKDSADTEKVFAKELDELTQVVARAVKLRIKLADGVGLVRVLGSDVLSAAEAEEVRAEEKQIDRKVADELGIATDRKKADKPGIKMLIPNFYRGDSHVVMLEIAVPKGKGVRTVADVYVQYKDLPHRKNRETHVAAKLQYTPDQSQVVASVNRSVKKNLLGFQTGEALMQAASLLEGGQHAEALKRLDERMVVLGVAAREWKDRDLDRDGRLLDRYKTVVAEYGRNQQLANGEFGDYLRKSLTFAGYQMTR
jgi:Mg-chelatase subunit ChlD